MILNNTMAKKEDWGAFFGFVIIILVLWGAGKYLDSLGGKFNSGGELAIFLSIVFLAYKLSQK